MRIAIYNQMFGLDGRSLLSNVLGHWAVHFQKDVRRINNKVELLETKNILEESDADICGVCEILEGQEKRISEDAGFLLTNKIGGYFSQGISSRYSGLFFNLLSSSPKAT